MTYILIVNSSHFFKIHFLQIKLKMPKILIICNLLQFYHQFFDIIKRFISKYSIIMPVNYVNGYNRLKIVP